MPPLAFEDNPVRILDQEICLRRNPPFPRFRDILDPVGERWGFRSSSRRPRSISAVTNQR